jgi:hypothetical protein
MAWHGTTSQMTVIFMHITREPEISPDDIDAANIPGSYDKQMML